MNLVEKGTDLISKVKTYWKTPMKGRYMTFKEIAAYSGGGIGAYMIITLGTACLLSANNYLFQSTLAIDPTDIYIMYVIAVIVNIPLTGIRASIIDNARNKAGKYRPYIVSMALPAAVICCIMVWFPYNKLGEWFGDGTIFGEPKAYVAKCAIVMLLNLLLHFFYYFFYDAYENLIHVLSPDTQERTDVSSVKSVVYSFAPTLVKFFTPLIAKHIFQSNETDIRVYRLLYPILTILGLLLCAIVYKYTEEKIVQARTHIVKIKFWDALKAVAKNKYFWIISLASWIGFLESAYSNIMSWLYNYGGACSADAYSIIVTVYGNASLWGMLLAPICVKKWGKKAVLIVTNIFNIVFILMMLPIVQEINGMTIWLILGCLYLNAFMGSFMHILNPSIQADIRDYQQYISGERIDGAFSVVTTIGTVVTLVTASVLPTIYENKGLTRENAAIVTSRPEILNRVLGDGRTVGELLSEQLSHGQDNYNNASSALYDLEILIPLIQVLIVLAAVGALMNVIPYIWYDFNEKKQKSVIRVLKVRSMFEDYSNGVLNDGNLVEAVDIIHNSREMADATPKEVNKASYKSISDKAEKKLAKKAYQADCEYNDEIEIAQFVCEELDKFSTDEFKFRIEESKRIYHAGIEGIVSLNINEARNELKNAKAIADKKTRKAAIEIAKSKIASVKAVKKYYGDKMPKQPDYTALEKQYEIQDNLEADIKKINDSLRGVKDKKQLKVSKARIEELRTELKRVAADTKNLRDDIANFESAVKPYITAKKLLTQAENYQKLDEISSVYEEAKVRHEKALADAAKEAERKAAEEKAYEEKLKAEKAAKKANKK